MRTPAWSTRGGRCMADRASTPRSKLGLEEFLDRLEHAPDPSNTRSLRDRGAGSAVQG